MHLHNLCVVLAPYICHQSSLAAVIYTALFCTHFYTPRIYSISANSFRGWKLFFFEFVGRREFHIVSAKNFLLLNENLNNCLTRLRKLFIWLLRKRFAIIWYSMCAIMTRSLYGFYKNFEVQKRLFKQLFRKFLTLCMVSIQERVMMARVRCMKTVLFARA